jgi:hypothetical protein
MLNSCLTVMSCVNGNLILTKAPVGQCMWLIWQLTEGIC